MHDADETIQQAIDDLRRAQETIPNDLADELQTIIEHAEDVLETLRKRDSAG